MSLIDRLAEKALGYVREDVRRFPPEEGGTAWIGQAVSDVVEEETRGRDGISSAFVALMALGLLSEVEDEGLIIPFHGGGRWRFDLERGVKRALESAIADRLISRHYEAFEKETGYSLCW